ncbi:MAG: exo-alpha-sialidase [Candidatus Hydrogenedentes bacterium]|nr:exo-alpha-sialidase [Candidatus Hydrogenedentota bacterium]
MGISALFASVIAAASALVNVPGVVVNHIPASEERYVGSPSIAVLPDGAYIMTHDEFGPKANNGTRAITRVFRSDDKGVTWKERPPIVEAFWSTVFTHRGALYLIGQRNQDMDVVIRKSVDGGATWTTPADKNSGLLAQGEFHCAPTPVLEHNGRLWRAMEILKGAGAFGHRFNASMLSVPVDADLLKAENWTFSNALPRDPAWLDGKFNGWLEGNAVVSPEGGIVDVLRVDSPADREFAAIINITPDGKQASFDPKHGFTLFPGGSKKFTIRLDPVSKKYWSLSNYVPKQFAGPSLSSVRNTLALISSPDLETWTVRCIVIHHPDPEKHGFQYVDWLFDGDDLIVANRAAYDDDQGGAHNFHDANFLTFHRIKNFRNLTMKDSVPGAPE